MTALAHSVAAERNQQPILGALRYELRDAKTLLEIGSGTGQHAVAFAAEFPKIVWQTSDLDESHDDIRGQIEYSGLENLRHPLSLDVRTANLTGQVFDAVYSCNTAHIMSFSAVEKMIPLVADVLASSGVFCYYGPFQRDGEFNTSSNANFHGWLQRRDSESGIRDLEKIDALATTLNMQRRRIYAMPANNLFVVWRKMPGGRG